MFSNLNKSAFGSSTSTPTFGFGNTSTTNQAPFGQTQCFGKSTLGFTQPTPLFGSTSQQNTGTLFSNTTVPSFGGTPQQTGFGTGLFGQQQNVGASSGTNGLFTGSSSASFGPQKQTASFGFGASTSTLFGQQQNQNFQPSTSGTVFGASPGFGGTAQAGTVIKFNPATGTDTMQKSGVTHSINTKHHCITCMKEYEGKSLEELRWEDYQANRKGPQSGFVPSTFGAPVSTAPSLFGQTDNKTAFGQTSAFGNPNTAPFNINIQPNQSTLFGKPNTGFGGTPTTNAFSFNSTPSAFGTSTIGKTFGSQPTQSVFGVTATTPAPSAFGNNLFPNTSQNTGTLFGKTSTQSVFSSPQQSFPFNQGTTTQPSFFQTSKPNTGFGNFGSTNLTTTAGFGQPNNLFSSQATANPFNAMQKPAQNSFGSLQVPFGLGTQPNTNTFFDGSKSLFGGVTPQHTFFSAPNTGYTMNQPQQTSLNQNNFVAQPNQDFHTHVENIYDPFPHCEFLLDAMKRQTQNTTDPNALKEILDQAPMPVTNIENNISKYRTVIKPRNINVSYPSCKYALMDDVMDKTTASNNNLSFRSGKKLVLRKTRSDRDMKEEYKRIVDSEDSNKNKSLFRNLQQLDNEKCDVLEEAKSKSPSSSLPVSPVYQNNVTFSSKSSQSPVEFGGGFEETPIRDKLDKPKAKQIMLNASTETDNDQAIEINSKSLIDKRDSSTSREKVVTNNESQTTANKENILSPGISLLDESSNNSESEDDVILIGEQSKISDEFCGIKLTHPECYTKPPLDQLHKFKNDKGEYIVKGFTIGRIGYGSIYFPDAMNVANLNLDEIVQFRYREITVYPDDSKKPPVGQGLNRRAQVKLEHVWPRDRNTHEVIRDVKEISKTNFVDRLCLLAERQNATFLDYDPETGSWLFTVNHFSKYKFTDSCDEECERYLLKGKNILEAKLKAFDTEEAELDKMGLGGVVISKELDTTAGYRIFRDPPQKDHSNPLFIIKSSFFEEESISDDESSCDVGIPLSLQVRTLNTRTHADTDQLSNREGVIKIYPLLYNSSDSVKSLNRFFSNNYVDSACFKGGSFKVRWGQGYKLTTRETSIGTVSDGRQGSLINRVQILDLTNEVVGIDKFIWEDHLRAVFELSYFSGDHSMLPTCSIKSSSDLIWKYYNVCNRWTNTYKNRDLKCYTQVWKLCTILWDSDDLSPVNKRKLFSKWLRLDLPSFEVDTAATHPKDAAILSLLKYYFAGEISSASKFATYNSYPALSLLLTQKQKCTNTYLKLQIEQWQQNGTLDVMDEQVLRMYMLLGGSDVIKGSNVFRDLGWKQVLATYLWHICPKNATFEDVMREYTQAFMIDGTAKYPLTPHHDEIPEMALDLQYRLLELYSNLSTDLKKVLNPFGYTKHIGDFHLRITDDILAMARPSTSIIIKKRVIDQFHSLGIKSIINLQSPKEHASCGEPLEDSGFSYDPSIFMENNIFYYNFAWKDYGDASLSELLNSIKVLAFAVTEGRVAIHCHAGLGRTGVLIACYLVYSLRVTANDAIKYIRLKRPGSVQTRGQIICVRHFAQFILPQNITYYIKDSKDKYMAEFTLKKFLKKQKIVLHGYDERNFKYLPKIIHTICERLLELCGRNTEEFLLKSSSMTYDFLCTELNGTLQSQDSLYRISNLNNLQSRLDLNTIPLSDSSYSCNSLSISPSPSECDMSASASPKFSDSCSDLSTLDGNADDCTEEILINETRCFQELQTQKQLDDIYSPKEICSTSDVIAALLTPSNNSDSELTESILQYEHNINTSKYGWVRLRSETDVKILSCLLLDWLECLKAPIFGRGNLEIIVICYNNVKQCLSKFDTEEACLIEYLLNFISKLSLSPEEETDILMRLTAALTQQTVIINSVALPQGRDFRKLREGTLKCTLQFLKSLLPLISQHHRKKRMSRCDEESKELDD